MVKHWKPKNVTSKVFNVANFKYLEDNIVVDNQKTTDELQDSLIADIVASANTLSSQVATNTTLQSTVATIVTDNITRDVDITDDAKRVEEKQQQIVKEQLMQMRLRHYKTNVRKCHLYKLLEQKLNFREMLK